ncbi:MAG TPA: CPBP family intramembrane metalloprotease [Phycisphaerales bacterium]|nr:CPBP family intramembrane metalloprotease [Phycisphaerales bacterium]
MSTALASGMNIADIASQAAESVDAPFDRTTFVFCAVGATVLIIWLRRYGGPRALAAAPVRRHSLPLSVPFLLFFVWMLLLTQLNVFVGLLYRDVEAGGEAAARYIALCVLNGLIIAVILWTARSFFARRLKGFGLNPKTLLRDAGWAAVNLIAAYPLVIGGIGLVIAIGRLLAGDRFTFHTHESLEELAESTRLAVRVLMAALLVVVVPVMEELLFRGLLQSAMRTLLPGVWPAILLTSALFAVVHSPMHAPGIFALACVMGYAYERSGSLFRPIFIHILFNGLAVMSLLLS